MPSCPQGPAVPTLQYDPSCPSGEPWGLQKSSPAENNLKGGEGMLILQTDNGATMPNLWSNNAQMARNLHDVVYLEVYYSSSNPDESEN